MDDKFAALPPGASLLGARGLDEFSLTGKAGTLTKVEVTGQPFARAARIVTESRPANPFSFQFSAQCMAPVAKGDALLGVFWARAVEPLPADGEAKTEFCIELAHEPYTKHATAPALLTAEWRRFFVPAEAKIATAAGEAGSRFRVGDDPQTIAIADVRVLNYGARVKLADLPFTANTYLGRDPQSPWRAEAAARIEKLRQGDLTVTVLDAEKKPVPDARISVRMKRHTFGFGSAVNAKLLLEDSPDAEKYREIVARDFNKVTIENHLKWGMWERDREIGLRAAAWLQEHGIELRAHCLFWGSRHNLPQRVAALFDQPDALRQTVLEHIANIAGAMKGRCVEWDVVNEPFSNFDVQNVLAGRGASAGRLEPELGAQSLAEWFRAARAADPAVKLYINDYSILSTGGTDREHQAYYERTIRELLRLGAPVEGIGMQGHFQDDLTPIPRLLTILDRFARLGLRIQVTEHDLTTWDEQLHADYTRDFMTALFSHPSVDGIVTWGFWEKAHWIPGAAYYRADWSLKPAGKAWHDLVFQQWWTNVDGATAQDGTFRTRGFLGDYDITAEARGHGADRAGGLASDGGVLKISQCGASSRAPAGSFSICPIAARRRAPRCAKPPDRASPRDSRGRAARATCWRAWRRPAASHRAPSPHRPCAAAVGEQLFERHGLILRVHGFLQLGEGLAEGLAPLQLSFIDEDAAEEGGHRLGVRSEVEAVGDGDLLALAARADTGHAEGDGLAIADDRGSHAGDAALLDDGSEEQRDVLGRRGRSADRDGGERERGKDDGGEGAPVADGFHGVGLVLVCSLQIGTGLLPPPRHCTRTFSR